MVKPEYMSLQELYHYVEYLKSNGQTYKIFDTAFWSKMFYPLAILVMLVLAMPFCLSKRTSRRYGHQDFLRHHDRHSVLRLKQYFCLHERIAKRAVFYFRAHAVADDVDTCLHCDVVG